MQRNRKNVDQYLRPWIDRDLLILVGQDHVELISSFVLALITTKDIKSEEARNELVDFLGVKTDHFIHELIAFALSSWNMSTFDQCSDFE